LLYRGGMSAGERRRHATELLTGVGLGDRPIISRRNFPAASSSASPSPAPS